MIALDFYSGSHGHFLEYVINSYIFKGYRVDSVLTELGTSHNAIKNINYQNTRLVCCGHYSEFNISVESPDRVITISIDNELANICYQINVECRAGDIPREKKKMAFGPDVLNSNKKLRNCYYSKFSDPELGYGIPVNLAEKWSMKNIPTFNVPMHEMYDIRSFYLVLKNLSEFLQHTFNPDASLAHLWQKFIQYNHGVQAWKNTTNIIEKSLKNEPLDFDLSIIDQALVNYHLTRLIGLQDGPLFDQDNYPTNSRQINRYIQNYIDDFDSRF